MARIIAITNQKGGVGKTTTAINLAASLAASEVPTLLVDCDPQANASSGVGFHVPAVAETDGSEDGAEEGAEQAIRPASLYSLLHGEVDALAACQPTAVEGLQLLPGSRDMVALNLELVTEDNRETRLRDALAPLREVFDFIVLDCPPALDLITLNALVAADGLIIPMQCEYFALEGLTQLLHTVEAVKENWNPELAIDGVLYTLHDERTNLSRQVADNLKEHFGEVVFRTSIPRNVRLAEAPSYGQPVLAYDLRSRGAEAYLQLAQEVLEREHARQRSLAQSAGARS